MVDVSIIICTYNRLWCLPRAIDSCRNTKCHTEIIVIDDGSTDGTWDWLQSQSNIISVRQHNQGQTYAINKGCSLATGQYIRFLDSDDFLAAGIIDRQLQTALLEKAELIYSRVDHFDELTKKISQCPEVGKWDDFLELQLSNRYGSHFLGMLFHRDLIKEVPRRPDYAFREDRMFLLEIGLLFPKLSFTDGCAGYWVQHSGQMQGNYNGLHSQVTNWQHLQIYRRILSILETRGQLSEKHKKAACTVLWPLAHWIAKNHIVDGNEVVKWIYQLDPDFKIPEKGFLGFSFQYLGFINTQNLLRLRRAFLYTMFKKHFHKNNA